MSEDVLKFKVKVTTEKEFDIVMPNVYLRPDMVESWEELLWPLGDDPAAELMYYIASMAACSPDAEHDGIGKLHTRTWEKPDRSVYSRIVEAYETDVQTEVEILSREDRE